MIPTTDQLVGTLPSTLVDRILEPFISQMPTFPLVSRQRTSLLPSKPATSGTCTAPVWSWPVAPLKLCVRAALHAGMMLGGTGVAGFWPVTYVQSALAGTIAGAWLLGACVTLLA